MQAGKSFYLQQNIKVEPLIVAEKHVQPGVTKGAIVGTLLDSHDVLKQSAQDQSYYAFRELLLSPSIHETVQYTFLLSCTFPLFSSDMFDLLAQFRAYL